ncbi:MAG: lipopolysaccharide biosynthesis protein [Deltaproteobacteria bacterium]|nr:lipopolysaccharide biosynthesis protein [Deltaproteobacteria bacterium]
MATSGSRRSAAAWQLASSYTGATLALVKGFVFIPLYFRFFDLATYGAYLASANVVGLLGVLDIGIGAALLQRLAFSCGRGDDVGFARTAGAGAATMGCTAFLIATIGWAIADYVPGWIHAPEASVSALALTFGLSALGTAALVLYQGVLNVPAAWQNPAVIAISRLGAQVTEIVVVLWGLFGGLGIVALGWGTLSGGIFGLVVSLTFVGNKWRNRGLPFPWPDWASLRWLFGVGIPTMLSRMAEQVASNLTVALVSRFLGPSQAAVYAITEKTLRVTQGFIIPIIGSALGGLAHLMGERGPSALLSPLRELRGLYTLVVSVLVPAVLVINRDLIALWIGAEKYGGTLLSSMVAMSVMVLCHFLFVSYTAVAVGQVRSSATLTTMEALFRVPLMFVGLIAWGPPGMVVGASVGYALLSLFAFPGVIGRGIGLAKSVAAATTGDGLVAQMVTLLLAVLAAYLSPVASGWFALFVKGLLASLALLVVTISLNPSARSQLSKGRARLGRLRRRSTSDK